MSDGMPQSTYNQVARGADMVLNTIRNQVAFILFDDLYDTDDAVGNLAAVFDGATFSDWSLEELRALQVVKQAAAEVLDGFAAVIGDPV